jgi:hypothetical protein
VRAAVGRALRRLGARFAPVTTVLLCQVHSRDAADPSRLSLAVQSGSSSVRLSAVRFATRFRFDSNSFLQPRLASAVRGTHRLPARFAIGPVGQLF